jgi:hypothetical protein
MAAKLLFELETGFVQTGFDLLKQMGSFRWEHDTCKWKFRLEDIVKVEGILGKPIEFTPTEAEVVLQRSPMHRTTVETEEFKGKGKITIEEKPECYVITEYRKVEDRETKEINIKAIHHEIPSANVVAMQQALENIDERRFEDHEIPTRRAAEEVCKVLGIDRFNRESGTYDYQKHFGCRKEMFTQVYYPLKVLQAKNEILYHKYGAITKLQRRLEQ